MYVDALGLVQEALEPTDPFFNFPRQQVSSYLDFSITHKVNSRNLTKEACASCLLSSNNVSHWRIVYLIILITASAVLLIPLLTLFEIKDFNLWSPKAGIQYRTYGDAALHGLIAALILFIYNSHERTFIFCIHHVYDQKVSES